MNIIFSRNKFDLRKIIFVFSLYHDLELMNCYHLNLMSVFVSLFYFFSLFSIFYPFFVSCPFSTAKSHEYSKFRKRYLNQKQVFSLLFFLLVLFLSFLQFLFVQLVVVEAIELLHLMSHHLSVPF